jgi:hypothetical protein
MMSTRARILLAWETETEILSRMTVLERARSTDIHEFRHMVDAGFLRREGN